MGCFFSTRRGVGRHPPKSSSRSKDDEVVSPRLFCSDDDFKVARAWAKAQERVLLVCARACALFG